MADRVLAEYFIEGGKLPKTPFKTVAMPNLQPRATLVELIVVANFVEVFLAREGHSGKVGINFLEKIQLPTLPSLFGAMLAGVDFILMGAGIPRAIPAVLDCFASGAQAQLRMDVSGAAAEESFCSTFVPRDFCGGTAPALKRPLFLGIIASATLALTLARKSSGHVDGFVVEGPTAGGHNAPPRGPLTLNAGGEPVYGVRDVPDLEKIRALELPFWLAGSYGRPGKLAEALAQGAAGIQVGTAFAFCEESDMAPELKYRTIQLSRAGQIRVVTDPRASPTGFPFKVAQLEGTLSEASGFAVRARVCDVGYLRNPYRRADGTVGYRCPAEPVDAFLRKGGSLEETQGRKCVCNGLFATIGLGQSRAEGVEELAFVTAGDDLTGITSFLPPGCNTYTAGDAIKCLLAHGEEVPLSEKSSWDASSGPDHAANLAEMVTVNREGHGQRQEGRAMSERPEDQSPVMETFAAQDAKA